MTPDQPGLFITFEGGEGGGKSTQARALKVAIEAAGFSVLLTREPGATSLGTTLRSILLNPDTKVDPRAEALMYAADRAQNVQSVIRPALNAGTVVICDRYIDSSIVYQGIGRGHGVDQIADLSLWAAHGLMPNLTIVLDLDPRIGVARALGRGDLHESKFEQLNPDFHRTVRDGFLNLPAMYPDRAFTVVDASQTQQAVDTQVWQAVEPLLHAAVASGTLSVTAPLDKAS